jgi:hypothetical protein
MRLRGLLVGLAVVLCARAATAQGARIPIPYRTYIALNPLGIPFDIASLEIESAIAQGVTVGALGSYSDIDDNRWTSFDFKLRYYPGEVVLRGFSIGMSAGSLRYSAIPSASLNGERQALSTATVGVLTDYNWMLGTQHRFIVGTGVGAKRVLANKDLRQRVDLDRAYVTARFVVGLAF